MSKLTDFKQHQENPFMNEAFKDVTDHMVSKKILVSPSKQMESHALVNLETGEYDVETRFLKKIEVDEKKFRKVYVDSLTQFADLNAPARKVLNYILDILPKDRDEFIFDQDKCMEYTGYKARKDVARGLAKLVEEKIIARSTKYYRYFINPMVVFNGDRILFATMYLRKKEEEIKQLQLFTEEELVARNTELQNMKNSLAKGKTRRKGK